MIEYPASQLEYQLKSGKAPLPRWALFSSSVVPSLNVQLPRTPQTRAIFFHETRLILLNDLSGVLVPDTILFFILGWIVSIYVARKVIVFLDPGPVTILTVALFLLQKMSFRQDMRFTVQDILVKKQRQQFETRRFEWAEGEREILQIEVCRGHVAIFLVSISWSEHYQAGIFSDRFCRCYATTA